MKFLSATAILTTVFLVCWTDQQLDSWEGEQQAMAGNLLSSCAAASQFAPLQEWDDLPANVQQYLNQVGSSNSKATALSIQQEGEFLMKKDQYVPFTAKEVFAQNPPGFSWEGKIAMAPYAPSWFPKLFVSDSWVEGLGQFTAAVQAIVPVIQTSSAIKEMEEQMALGQATRWLADAVLLPSTLQPSSGMVTWKFLSDDKAILEMPVANVRGLQLEATFDSASGLLTQVTGTKPFLKSGNDFAMKTWQVNFMDYQQTTSGMMVPMKMESGWVNEKGDFEAHYKIDNKSLQYIDGSNAETS